MVDDPSHVRLLRIMALPSIILIPPPESPLVESIARKPYDSSYSRCGILVQAAHYGNGVDGALTDIRLWDPT
jgi:hypothetical protein